MNATLELRYLNTPTMGLCCWKSRRRRIKLGVERVEKHERLEFRMLHDSFRQVEAPQRVSYLCIDFRCIYSRTCELQISLGDHLRSGRLHCDYDLIQLAELLSFSRHQMLNAQDDGVRIL